MVALGGALGWGADEPLPKAESILDRFIEVTGGKAAYGKIKTETQTGTIAVPAQGVSMKFTSYAVEGRRFIVFEAPGIGKMEEGVSGDVAWSRSAAMGPRLKQGEEKTKAIRDSRLLAQQHWRENMTKAETVGVEDVDGKPAYKVLFTPKVGKVETHFYDKATGLLVKKSVIETTPMGEIPAEMTMTDYRPIGGIRTPHASEMKAMGNLIRYSVESAKYNEPIPDSTFTLPTEIQALVNKSKVTEPRQ